MTRNSRYEPIEGEELYRKLAMGEPVVIVDVRTEEEHAAKHVPGSLLVPIHELGARIPEIPNSGTPITVLSEKGNRAAAACKLLAEHGFSPLFTLEGGIEQWPGPTASGSPGRSHNWFGIEPSRFLVRNFDFLTKGVALDLAMGFGGNSLYLATRGFDVDGVDFNPEAVAAARSASRQLGVPIRAILGNVEDGTFIIPEESYETILVFNFLHRPLFKELREGVKPRGTIIYETFTVDQRRYGPPNNPDYLLEPCELRERFQDWEILSYHESTAPERPGGTPRARAGIVARKPE